MANLSGFATLTVNAPFSSDGFLTVTGNVDIGTGATLVHARNDTAELYRIDLKVGGNLTVAVGGGIDVTAMGYGSGKGPGARGGGSGSHGGLGGYDSGYLLTYGSALAPTNLGSGGDAQSYGGGAIRLDVTGAAFVDGAFVADGQQGPARSGAGGSIYLTAGTLAGSGNIRANGGTHSTSAWAGGGGGRVAIILRQAGAEFGVFGGTIQARGGVNSAGNGAAGTVYLQTADEAAGAGVVMIDNVGLTTAAGVFTTIPAQKWPNAEELKHASVVVTNRGRLAVATNGVVDALAIASSTESLGLGEANTVLTVNSLTVHGIAYTRGGSYTVANNWNNHPGGVPSNVSGDGAIELWRPAGSLFLLR